MERDLILVKYKEGFDPVRQRKEREATDRYLIRVAREDGDRAEEIRLRRAKKGEERGWRYINEALGRRLDPYQMAAPGTLVRTCSVSERYLSYSTGVRIDSDDVDVNREEVDGRGAEPFKPWSAFVSTTYSDVVEEIDRHSPGKDLVDAKRSLVVSATITDVFHVGRDVHSLVEGKEEYSCLRIAVGGIMGEDLKVAIRSAESVADALRANYEMPSVACVYALKSIWLDAFRR